MKNKEYGENDVHMFTGWEVYEAVGVSHKILIKLKKVPLKVSPVHTEKFWQNSSIFHE